MQAIDHVVNSAAKIHYMSGGQISCPIVFRGPNGAAAAVGMMNTRLSMRCMGAQLRSFRVSLLTAAQHSQCFAAWYSSVPGTC